ncbi:unnamed protein product [Amoebophrya sp. A25]|nr:unnamed protein product [Amoebophrya sp. A25]|eukprot:GSA25T00005785001.1
MSSRSLLARWRCSSPVSFAVEIHAARCMFELAESATSSSPTTNAKTVSILLNSANEGLCGIQYPQFPRGGYASPVPFRTPKTILNWCRDPTVLDNRQEESADGKVGDKNKDVASKFVIPENCVDGKTHRLAGEDLGTFLLKEFPILNHETEHAVRVLPGTSVWTPSFGALKSTFPDGIIHAVAPFRDFDYSEVLQACRGNGSHSLTERNDVVATVSLLRGAYVRALRLAYQKDVEKKGVDVKHDVRIVGPFLGTGVRGFALDEGARVAAIACSEFCEETHEAEGTATKGTSTVNTIPTEGGAGDNCNPGSRSPGAVVDPHVASIKNAEYLRHEETDSGALNYDRDDWFFPVNVRSTLSQRHDEPDLFRKILESKTKSRPNALARSKSSSTSMNEGSENSNRLRTNSTTSHSKMQETTGSSSEQGVAYTDNKRKLTLLLVTNAVETEEQAKIVQAFEETRTKLLKRDF